MLHRFSSDELKSRIAGEICTDALTRTCYGVDASIFNQEPLAVVSPKSQSDVIEVVRYAAECGIPITPRGAGTGITGGCLGPGIVIDFSRYMNRILDVDVENEFAIVEPGVIQDILNRELADHGRRFGPDTSTGNRATIGGMLGNNSSGAHSLRYGRTIDSIIEIDVVLADGSVQTFGPGRDSTETTKLKRVISELAPEIDSRYPKIQRNVAGYCLDELVTDDANYAKLFCGAEGTLGICTKLKVAITRSPSHVGLVVFHFKSLTDGLEHVPRLLTHDPFSLELIDGTLIELGRDNPSFTGALDWLDGAPDGILTVEFDAEDEETLHQKIETCLTDCDTIGYARTTIIDDANIAEVWALRKAGLGLLLSRRTKERALAFIEDVAVPPEKLGTFTRWIRDHLSESGCDAGFFGHAGVGLVHVRPMIDLSAKNQPEAMLSIMQTVTEKVLELNGSPSGEHGDGMIRSWLLEHVYGTTITEGFRRIKTVLDPNGIMNPGKIVDAKFPDELIRPSLIAQDQLIDTAFTFPDTGGLAFAAAMCNGNAACRKFDGAMCPSFQATGDERDTTRARATAIQKAFTTSDPTKALAGIEIYDVMELCLQCKACTTECPSQVDVAKMKSECLYHYQRAHGVSLRNRLFANVDTASKFASLAPSVSNALMTSFPVKSLLSAIGVTDKRPPMAFAKERFTSWYAKRNVPSGDGDKVALFVDTFSEFNYPQIPQAAVHVLTALNCDLVVAPYTCCGRPAISKGLLDAARKKAERIRRTYAPLVKSGYRIVGLEPGCILTFRDEHPALLGEEETKRIADASTTIEEYLFERLQAGTLDLDWSRKPAHVLVHGHCHQKAQVGTSPALEVLRSIPGFTVEEVDGGCCGMAGTFGYETEHYDLSMEIGEKSLFPAVRAAAPDTLIVASGASCRSHISHGAQRDGIHFIEAVKWGVGQ